jgi:hypothetical protein
MLGPTVTVTPEVRAAVARLAAQDLYLPADPNRPPVQFRDIGSPLADEDEDTYEEFVVTPYETDLAISNPVTWPDSPGRDWPAELAAMMAERDQALGRVTELEAVLRESVRATEERMRAELAADPETCPVDHRCDEEEPCGCWCEVHDCPIGDCPTFRMVDAALTQLTAERDAALARAQAAEAALELAEVDRDSLAALTPHPCGMPDLYDVTETGQPTELRCATCGTHVVQPQGQSNTR